jgi:hypothetical protein
MNARPRSSPREAAAPVEKPATTCTRCPVCGTEECLTLEELGTYCATMTAASLAVKEEEAAKAR